MKKLNETIYNKLLLQAEEAKDRGMTKLAAGILDAIGSYHDDSIAEYSYSQLQEEVYRDLWKIAARYMAYYNVESADAEKMSEAISTLTKKLSHDLEQTLGTDSMVKGPFEPKVFGEDK